MTHEMHWLRDQTQERFDNRDLLFHQRNGARLRWRATVTDVVGSDEAKPARQSLHELPPLPARASGVMAKDHGNAASFIAVVHIEMVNGNLGHRAGSPHRHRTLVQQKSKLHDPLRTWAMLAHCDA